VVTRTSYTTDVSVEVLADTGIDVRTKHIIQPDEVTA
jgi:hypothetical protein